MLLSFALAVVEVTNGSAWLRRCAQLGTSKAGRWPLGWSNNERPFHLCQLRTANGTLVAVSVRVRDRNRNRNRNRNKGVKSHFQVQFYIHVESSAIAAVEYPNPPCRATRIMCVLALHTRHPLPNKAALRCRSGVSTPRGYMYLNNELQKTVHDAPINVQLELQNSSASSTHTPKPGRS